MQQAVAAKGWGRTAHGVRAAAVLRAVLAAERGRFAPWLPVCLGAGIALYFALRIEPAAWSGPAAMLLAGLLVALLRRDLIGRGAAIAVLAAALGFTAAQVGTWRALPLVPLPTHAVHVDGVVRDVDVLPDGGRRLTLGGAGLAEWNETLARTIRIRLRANDTAAPVPGDRVQVRALLRPPPPPAYPGAWDLQRGDYFSGLGGSGFALGPVTIAAPADAGGVAAWWQRLRATIAARLMAGLPGGEGAIAATMLTGSGTAIPPADRAAFVESGLAHLLAVAGLHIGIVMGLAMALTRTALALSERAALNWPCKPIAAGVALLAGGFYLALTGGHLPILRSFAMASLVVLALALGRRALSLRGLALAAGALLLLRPQELTGVSFQMSFSAVLALISGYEVLRPALRRLYGEGGWWRRLLHHAAMLALTSLLAGTASLPFAAYNFGQIQLYYVIANLVAVPVAAFWVMPAGMAALALMPLGLEHLALAPMGWGIAALLAIGRTVSAWPAATLPVPHAPVWGLLLVAFGIAWLGLWRSRLRLLGLLPLALGLASPALVRPPDLLVSPDARWIGLRTPAGIFVEKTSGASKFVLHEWEEYWAAGPAQRLPDSGDAAGGLVECTEAVCQLRAAPGGPVALLLRRRARPPSCAGAAVILAAEPLRRRCPPGPPVIDRFTVWRDGAQAVWLGPDGVRILSDRDARGDRPWVPPPPASRHRLDPGLRMAKPDALPTG